MQTAAEKLESRRHESYTGALQCAGRTFCEAFSVDSGVFTFFWEVHNVVSSRKLMSCFRMQQRGAQTLRSTVDFHYMDRISIVVHTRSRRFKQQQLQRQRRGARAGLAKKKDEDEDEEQTKQEQEETRENLSEKVPRPAARVHEQIDT